MHKMKGRSYGFTLVEILIVVIIIAVLAAIAVLAYQRAVVKSRFSSLMPTTRAIRDGQEDYYMRNGTYATAIEDLDIKAANTSGMEIVPGDSTDTDLKYVFATRPNLNNNLLAYQQHSPKFSGHIHCEALKDNSLAEWLCSSALHGTKIAGSVSGDDYETYVLEGELGPNDYFAQSCDGDGELQCDCGGPIAGTCNDKTGTWSFSGSCPTPTLEEPKPCGSGRTGEMVHKAKCNNEGTAYEYYWDESSCKAYIECEPLKDDVCPCGQPVSAGTACDHNTGNWTIQCHMEEDAGLPPGDEPCDPSKFVAGGIRTPVLVCNGTEYVYDWDESNCEPLGCRNGASPQPNPEEPGLCECGVAHGFNCDQNTGEWIPFCSKKEDLQPMEEKCPAPKYSGGTRTRNVICDGVAYRYEDEWDESQCETNTDCRQGAQQPDPNAGGFCECGRPGGFSCDGNTGQWVAQNCPSKQGLNPPQESCPSDKYAGGTRTRKIVCDGNNYVLGDWDESGCIPKSTGGSGEERLDNCTPWGDSNCAGAIFAAGGCSGWGGTVDCSGATFNGSGSGCGGSSADCSGAEFAGQGSSCQQGANCQGATFSGTGSHCGDEWGGMGTNCSGATFSGQGSYCQGDTCGGSTFKAGSRCKNNNSCMNATYDGGCCEGQSWQCPPGTAC